MHSKLLAFPVLIFSLYIEITSLSSCHETICLCPFGLILLQLTRMDKRNKISSFEAAGPFTSQQNFRCKGLILALKKDICSFLCVMHLFVQWYTPSSSHLPSNFWDKSMKANELCAFPEKIHACFVHPPPPPRKLQFSLILCFSIRVNFLAPPPPPPW